MTAPSPTDASLRERCRQLLEDAASITVKLRIVAGEQKRAADWEACIEMVLRCATIRCAAVCH